MAQIKSITWTNANPAVAHNLDVGFTVSEITIVDKSNGGSWYWTDGMVSGTVLDVDSGVIAGANGVTPLAQSAVIGASISAFTNANPGVITATGVSALGFAAGDTVSVVALADDATGTTLNGIYTVASVTASTITLTTDTSLYSVYVSGGYVTRVSDAAGQPVPTQNVAIRGVTLGTSAVGGAGALMAAIVKGKESVV